MDTAPRASNISENQPYKLYYLGGQSNMDGFGYNSELPDVYQGELDRVVIYRGQSEPDQSALGGAGHWQVLQPGFGFEFATDGVASSLSNRFGPEVTFGHRIAALNPQSKIAIVKYSRGGTPLYVHGSGYGTWSPEVPGNNQYDFALRALHESTTLSDIDGDGIDDILIPSGIIWMQGEADAFDSVDAAQAYEANLSRMMDLFRAALGVDDLPVVIGQITDSGRADDGKVMDWSDDVRAAQQRYTSNDSCAALVTVTNEFEYPDSDDWHYSSDGYIRLGTAFADAVAALEASCQE
ncbi:MAG: sialate O-acetylesterase [Pseudomonadota bacterium]